MRALGVPPQPGYLHPRAGGALGVRYVAPERPRGAPRWAQGHPGAAAAAPLHSLSRLRRGFNFQSPGAGAHTTAGVANLPVILLLVLCGY